jgi:PAS domain S-box-containing protein
MIPDDLLKHAPVLSEIVSLEDAASKILYSDCRVAVFINEMQEPIGILSAMDILGAGRHPNATAALFRKDFPKIRHTAVIEDIPTDAGNDAIVVVDDKGAYMGIIQAVDLLKHMLYLAQERVTELTTAIDSSYDGFCFTDGNGVMKETNANYYKISGFTPSEIIGTNVRDLEKRGYVSKAISLMAIESKSPVTIFQTYRNGKTCMNTASPVFNSKNEITAVVTNVRDITELIRLKEELTKTQELSENYEDELLQLRFERYKQNQIVVKSQQMNRVVELAFKVGQVDTTVLITGESGVGKEIIANVMHHFHPERTKGPFIKINCSAYPEHLLESELFGYEKGAFTGARPEGKSGMFELAHNGTIFLDEISEIPLTLQAKLLRVIQEKELTRLGGTRSISLNIRIIASTNGDLQQLVSQGRFRGDLFYRLNVVQIRVPPLRDRKADIQPLVFFFLSRFCAKYSRERILPNDVLTLLEEYDWPGNIRELENLVENLVVTSEGIVIQPEELPIHLKSRLYHQFDPDHATFAQSLKKIEEEILIRAFKKYGTQKDVARALKTTPSTICRKMKKLKGRLPA